MYISNKKTLLKTLKSIQIINTCKIDTKILNHDLFNYVTWIVQDNRKFKKKNISKKNLTGIAELRKEKTIYDTTQFLLFLKNLTHKNKLFIFFPNGFNNKNILNSLNFYNHQINIEKNETTKFLTNFDIFERERFKLNYKQKQLLENEFNYNVIKNIQETSIFFNFNNETTRLLSPLYNKYNRHTPVLSFEKINNSKLFGDLYLFLNIWTNHQFITEILNTNIQPKQHELKKQKNKNLQTLQQNLSYPWAKTLIKEIFFIRKTPQRKFYFLDQKLEETKEQRTFNNLNTLVVKLWYKLFLNPLKPLKRKFFTKKQHSYRFFPKHKTPYIVPRFLKRSIGKRMRLKFTRYLNIFILRQPPFDLKRNAKKFKIVKRRLKKEIKTFLHYKKVQTDNPFHIEETKKWTHLDEIKLKKERGIPESEWKSFYGEKEINTNRSIKESDDSHEKFLNFLKKKHRIEKLKTKTIWKWYLHRTRLKRKRYALKNFRKYARTKKLKNLIWLNPSLMELKITNQIIKKSYVSVIKSLTGLKKTFFKKIEDSLTGIDAPYPLKVLRKLNNRKLKKAIKKQIRSAKRYYFRNNIYPIWWNFLYTEYKHFSGLDRAWDIEVNFYNNPILKIIKLYWLPAYKKELKITLPIKRTIKRFCRTIMKKKINIKNSRALQKLHIRLKRIQIKLGRLVKKEIRELKNLKFIPLKIKPLIKKEFTRLENRIKIHKQWKKLKKKRKLNKKPKKWDYAKIVKKIKKWTENKKKWNNNQKWKTYGNNIKKKWNNNNQKPNLNNQNMKKWNPNNQNIKKWNNNNQKPNPNNQNIKKWNLNNQNIKKWNNNNQKPNLNNQNMKKWNNNNNQKPNLNNQNIKKWNPNNQNIKKWNNNNQNMKKWNNNNQKPNLNNQNMKKWNNNNQKPNLNNQNMKKWNNNNQKPNPNNQNMKKWNPNNQNIKKWNLNNQNIKKWNNNNQKPNPNNQNIKNQPIFKPEKKIGR